jgi:hypothetical protein
VVCSNAQVTSIPAHPSDLTPAWLTEVLGTEVVAVEVLEHSFATNQRARIAPTYANRPVLLPAEYEAVKRAALEGVGA